MNNNSGWYEPLDRSVSDENAGFGNPSGNAAASPVSAGDRKAKRRGVWMVLLIILMAAALLVLSSFVFSKLFHSRFSFSVNNNGDVSSFSFGEGNDEGFSVPPFEAPGEDSGSTEEDYPDNVDDFFSSFFTPAESYDVQIDAETYKGKLDQRLELTENVGERLSLQELYVKCSPFVVTIITYQNKNVEYGMGTGICGFGSYSVYNNIYGNSTVA